MKLLVVCSTSLLTPDWTLPLWFSLALIWSLNSSLIFSVKMESFGWSMTFFKLSFKLRYEIYTQMFWSEISAFGLLSPIQQDFNHWRWILMKRTDRAINYLLADLVNLIPELSELFSSLRVLNSCKMLNMLTFLYDCYNGWFICQHEVSVALLNLTVIPKLLLNLADVLDSCLLFCLAQLCKFIIEQEAQLNLAMAQSPEVGIDQVEQIE